MGHLQATDWCEDCQKNTLHDIARISEQGRWRIYYICMECHRRDQHKIPVHASK